MLSAMTDTECTDAQEQNSDTKAPVMDLSLKESQPFTPPVLTLHSSFPPPSHHTPLSFCFKSSPAGRNIPKTEKNERSLNIKLAWKRARVAVANHKRVECHLLVHNLSSLAF